MALSTEYNPEHPLYQILTLLLFDHRYRTLYCTYYLEVNITRCSFRHLDIEAISYLKISLSSHDGRIFQSSAVKCLEYVRDFNLY